MTPLRLGFVLAATFVCAVMLPSVTQAEPTRVLVESSCTPSQLELSELLYLLRVELPSERVQVATTLAELGSAQQPDMHVQFCFEGAPVERLALRVAQAPIELRELDVVALPPNARVRALALALAEIIESAPPAAPAAEARTVAEPSAEPSKATEPRPAADIEETALDIRRPASGLRAVAAFTMRSFMLPSALDRRTLLYGPELGFDIARWHFAAVLLLGRVDSPLGGISLGTATGAAAYDVWRSSGDIAFAARARGELGVTWAAGEPNDDVRAHSSAALAASALLELALRARLVGALAIDLRTALGYARGLGALAEGNRSATTHGLVLGLSAGLSYEL